MSYALMRNLKRQTVLSRQMHLKKTMSVLTPEDLIVNCPPATQWSNVLKEAENIVGYPTSPLNLRCLLSDESISSDMSFRLLLEINHPIVKTVKTLYKEQNNIQPWSVIILLLSKAITPPQQTNRIVENQRILAELTEMFRAAHHVHRGLINIPHSQRDNTTMFANKIAILIGDYLLATAYGMLAQLKNPDVHYLISTGIRDLSEGELFGQRDGQNLPLPGKPVDKTVDEYTINSDTLPLEVLNTLGLPVREWTLRNMYGGGTLFGRGCQGATLLAGLGDKDQENAYKFGCHLHLARQAATDYQVITSERKEIYSLVSAPVLFALNNNPELYNVIQNTQNFSAVDLNQLKLDIMNTDAVERTRLLHVENANKAKTYVETFGDGELVNIILKLIKSLKYL